MKKYLFIALSMCAVLSCSKADLNTNKAALSFTAGFDESTKSMLNSDRSQSWTGGDKVSIYDVTDATNFGLKATFTNNSATPSTAATFTVDAEYSTFEFVSGHIYVALHNATAEPNSDGTKYRIVFAKNIIFDSDKKYGMPDNTIPVAYYFIYNGPSSLSNFTFHNVAALCVIRVANSAGEALDITSIKLSTTTSVSSRSWVGDIFEKTYTDFGLNTNYKFVGSSASSNSAQITCNNTIGNGSICDYSVPIIRVYGTGMTDVTLNVKVNYGTSSSKTESVVICKQGEAEKYSSGDTKVIPVTITSTGTKSSVSISGLTETEVTF